MYSGKPVIKFGRLPPCHGYFPYFEFYHNLAKISTSAGTVGKRSKRPYFQHHINITEQKERPENPIKSGFPVQTSAIRTLFTVVDKVCFILLFLAKSYHFDTFLLIVYVVSNLVYPNCTQEEILPKVVTCHNFLKKNHIIVISHTLCSQLIFVFAYVYPILHNIRQRQVADTEHLSPLHF